MTYGEDFHLARLTGEFTQLCGIIGYRIKDTIGWAPWSRLVSLYSWRKVLRAVEQCAPGQRWAADAEKYCIQYAKDEADAAAPVAPKHLPPSRQEGQARAEEFAKVRARIMGDTK